MAKTKGHWKWMNEEYGKWLTKLDQELLRRTGQNTDSFSDYPYAEDFIVRNSPEETATMMIDFSGKTEIKGESRRVIMLDDSEMLSDLILKIRDRIDDGYGHPGDQKKLKNLIRLAVSAINTTLSSERPDVGKGNKRIKHKGK
ncbi:MAG: hypothetical protein WB554_01085 [Desulfomonilaceae bacterium]